MRLPEQRLWDAVRDAATGTKLLLERIENRVGDGTPDVHALCAGIATWAELKVAGAPPANPGRTPALGAKHGARLSQRNWHLDYQRHGGRSCFIIKVQKSIFTVSGRFADDINKATFAELALMASGPPTIANALSILRGETPL